MGTVGMEGNIMKLLKVETAQRNLETEITQCKHTNEAPFSNGKAKEHVLEYIYACMAEGVGMVDCKEKLAKMYNEVQNADEHRRFMGIIEIVLDALYGYKSIIGNK